MKTYEEYKVSGVKWLGKVPKHWEICRFKDFISLQTQTSLSENKIGLENIECATGKFIETNSEFEGNGIAFDVGDVIYGKLRPYLKKVWELQYVFQKEEKEVRIEKKNITKANITTNSQYFIWYQFWG